MLEGYEAIRAAVARAMAMAGVSMCRLEEAMEDADWQHWLVDSVSQADLVLGDVSEHNAFVMYELGLAHQQRLPTTLIVNAAGERVPATVRGTPFLPYYDDFASFEKALAAILWAMAYEPRPADPAVALGALADRYNLYYEQALSLMEAFRATVSVPMKLVSRSTFFTRLRVAENRGDWFPDGCNKQRIARYLLARIISNSDEIPVMQAAEAWIQAEYTHPWARHATNLDAASHSR